MTPTLSDIVKKIDAELMFQDEKREWMLKFTREIERNCAAIIMASHKHISVEVLKQEFSTVRHKLTELSEGLKEMPMLLYSGAVMSAQAEATEAAILLSLVESYEKGEEVIPSPKEIGVCERAYLSGLSDVIGELRRFVLESLKCGELERAEAYYHWMDEIFSSLNTLNYTRFSSELRKKLDVARLLIERTLGDVVNARQMTELKSTMRGRQE